MASIKELKKDIHFLTYELASETMFKMLLRPEADENALNQIALDGTSFRDELIKRANHRDAKNNPKLVKQYYKTLRKEMMEGYTNLFKRLEEVK